LLTVVKCHTVDVLVILCYFSTGVCVAAYDSVAMCRYYAAFPSLSDKCDMLAAGSCSSSVVQPAWARVAQTHPRAVDDDTKIIAVDSGINLAHDVAVDGGRSIRGGPRSSGNLPNNSRRHRKLRGGHDDGGRRRKQPSRRMRAQWGNVGEGSQWLTDVRGFPLLCSDRDDPMSYWPLQLGCCGGRFFQPAEMIDSDWLLPESYKDRFADLASSEWTRPSFEEGTTVDLVPVSIGLTPDSIQDSADTLCARNMLSPPCRDTSETLDRSESASGGGSTQHLGHGDVTNSDFGAEKDPDSEINKSVEISNQISANCEQSVIADCLADELGNLSLPRDDLRLSILCDGSFGAIPGTAEPNLTGISIAVDDDRFLGCRPFDPALWRVLNSSRMWCGNPSLSGELRLVPSTSECGELYNMGLQVFGVDLSPPSDWSNVENILDHSGCLDISDNFSLLSLLDENARTLEMSRTFDDHRTPEKLSLINSSDRLMCTEMLGNSEVWDGSRIAEAVLENDAVVTVISAEAVRQIWQPAYCRDIDNISISGCEEGSNSNSDSSICHHHIDTYSRDDQVSVISGLVDVPCRSKFRDWTDNCHCVGCIWQSDLLSGGINQSPSTTTGAQHAESNPRTGEINRERPASLLPSSSSESSFFWTESQHDIDCGESSVKGSSTWDSQLFSSDCLEPSLLDHTSGSDKLRNNGHVTSGKVLTSSSTSGNGDGTLDDLLAKKPSHRSAFLLGGELLGNTQLESYPLYEDNLEHNDSGLDPDDDEDDTQLQTEDFSCITDVDIKIADSSTTEASEIRKFFYSPMSEVELDKSALGDAEGCSNNLAAGVSSSCSTCYPVSSLLTDQLEENNNLSSVGLSEADCEEIVQLLPSLASVSDIIFSDDSLDSEPDSSDASVFTSPEPCSDELATTEELATSIIESASLVDLVSSFDHLISSDLASDSCSMAAQCYASSSLAPVYTLDGSSLWFRDSCNISASVDAISQLHSDLQSSAGWFPASVAHNSVCTAVAQCSRLLPSENTAFRDIIPQRLEMTSLHFEPETMNFCSISPLSGNKVHQSSTHALLPWLWPTCVDESLSVKVRLNSSNQFRPIGTPSTTDSELSDSSTSTAEVVAMTTDSLTDFATLVMTDMLAGSSYDTYQRFIGSRSDDEAGNGDAALFHPSFKVHYELEKAAQTGEPSLPVPGADVDLRLGCLVKQVLGQLSGEFPESSSNVDVLYDAGDASNVVSSTDDAKVDDVGVTMSRQLSEIWNDTIDSAGTGLDVSSSSTMSDLSAMSCKVSQIWTHPTTTGTDTTSPSFSAMHGRQLSDIWSDNTTVGFDDDGTYASHTTGELVLSGVQPDIWKDAGERTAGVKNTNKLQRMWNSVDSGDTSVTSDGGGVFSTQSIWSISSRLSSAIAEVETLRPVMEDPDLVSPAGCSHSLSSHSDQCDVSPSELNSFWGAMTSDLESSTPDGGKCGADGVVKFHVGGGGGLQNCLLGTDNIWSRSEVDVCGAECGEAGVKASWNVDPLYCSGNSTSVPGTAGGGGDPDSVDDDPQLSWTRAEAGLDADVAFAFTQLVSEVVSLSVSIYV